MRWLPILFVIPLLSGCLQDDSEPDTPKMSADSILAANPLLLAEGEWEDTGDAVIFSWPTGSQPFSQEFAIPEGATMIRAIGDPGDGTAAVSMSHVDTGRRRCNQQSVVGFTDALTGPRSCSSIVIDPPGTLWSFSTSGANEARLEFYRTPLDGPAAHVDWSLLSPADHDLRPTQGFTITAHDGVELWVELTLPVGEGPWPTIVAASPYNGQAGRIPEAPGEGEPEGTPAMWTYWTQDYAKRGYAAVNIDVRGFGKSGGCVEVWGINEQLDQKTIVEWVAAQDWSDGAVGFYGQSYVATTPVAAAVQAPEALKAIIAVAPVIDSYHDWHYGGVPNGESSLSPVAYQALVDMLGTTWLQEDPMHATDLPTLLQYATQGICDPTLVPLANDPRAIHGPFYDERDFGARAADIEAAVLFTQGFEDANVKSAMIPDWFNDIEATKLGLFGHWLHQHPARMDAEALFLGWMEEHVKGKPLGIAEAYGPVQVTIDAGHMRGDIAWPAEPLAEVALDFTALDLDITGMSPVSEPVTDTAVLPNGTILSAAEIAVVGDATGPAAMLYAELVEQRPDGTQRLLTWGLRNLALSDDYETYAPTTGPFDAIIPLRPTEHVIADGSVIQVTLRSAQLGESTGIPQPLPGTITFDSVTLQWSDVGPAEPIALTALP